MSSSVMRSGRPAFVMTPLSNFTRLLLAKGSRLILVRILVANGRRISSFSFAGSLWSPAKITVRSI